MKVTVCELPDHEPHFLEEWSSLKEHLGQHKPDWLLLPEMPFGKWIAAERTVSEVAKMRSVEKHERWMEEVERLNVPYVVYSKPVISNGKFFNTAFVFEKGSGHFRIHTKSFFPEDPFFWEETWYDPESPKAFDLLELGGLKIGALLCTEMWFTQYAREYGKQGIDLLFCPRATGLASVNQWTRCGQTLSVISGAYCLSANRSGKGENGFQWGGSGWISEPMTGDLLGRTTAYQKFVTRTIDINMSKKAKTEYPLNVRG